MILLDILGISESIRDGDTLTLRFINNYKSYEKTNDNPLFSNPIGKQTIIEKKVKVDKFLGEGSYGKVYKVKIDDKKYALKINENEDPHKLYERYTSLKSNSKLEKYIINIYCAGEIKSNFFSYSYYSIMEYGGKSIRHIVDAIDLNDLQIILKQLFNIVYVASKYKILLTDFKLSNLTFSSDKRVKLIDLYMYCESYIPCRQCKIVKTYSSLEIDKEKRIYENSDYNYTCIYLPFAICLIDLVCIDSASHYCSKLSKKYGLDMGIKEIIPLLQISCFNYTNESNDSIKKKYSNLHKYKKKIEKEYKITKENEFFDYFFNLLEPKREFENFLSKKKLILIISNLITLDPEQRSIDLLKEKLNSSNI
jgi:hypothetical protein